MLMPNKHTRFSDSLLGLAGYLLTYLKLRPYSVEALWHALKRDKAHNALFARHSFTDYLLSIDFLFMVGVVTIDSANILTFSHETD